MASSLEQSGLRFFHFWIVQSRNDNMIVRIQSMATCTSWDTTTLWSSGPSHSGASSYPLSSPPWFYKHHWRTWSDFHCMICSMCTGEHKSHPPKVNHSMSEPRLRPSWALHSQDRLFSCSLWCTTGRPPCQEHCRMVAPCLGKWLFAFVAKYIPLQLGNIINFEIVGERMIITFIFRVQLQILDSASGLMTLDLRTFCVFTWINILNSTFHPKHGQRAHVWFHCQNVSVINRTIMQICQLYTWCDCLEFPWIGNFWTAAAFSQFLVAILDDGFGRDFHFCMSWIRLMSM